ncbi:MAG TPA: ABC transporter substrate-binding protein [Terriglobales bacterium]|nr:ABC transporter substrate-binding protein [Terriglobales bacterium]
MLMRRAPLAFVVMVGCLLAACEKGAWHPTAQDGSKEKLKIKYFWAPSDSDHHYSSVRTAIEAAQGSDEFKKVDPYVELSEYKDSGSQEDAIQEARILRRSPDVLAVIGHPRSGATLAALPFYAQAGIPVLIPSATSPYLLYRHAEGEIPDFSATRPDLEPPRFANAFRLTPSDIPDQAHALELTIKQLGKDRKIKTPKVMLICDSTGGTRSSTYSKPMCDYLASEAGDAYDFAITVSRNVDLEKGNISGVITEIHAEDPNFIVLVGYQELARALLEELKERADRDMPHKKIENYTLIMPDACLTNDLIDFGAQVYVTSPMNPQRAVACTSPRGEAYSEALKFQRASEKVVGIPETDEGFVYDSVLILAAAVDDCNQSGDLNRGCVLRYLNKHHTNLLGACESYHIEQGERQNAYYYVYAQHVQGKQREMRPRWFTRKEDHELYPSDSWDQQSH